MPLYVAEFEFRYNNRLNSDIFGTAIASAYHHEASAVATIPKMTEMTIPTAETKETTNTAVSKGVSRMIFGLDLQSWEQWMLLSLGLAAFAAVAVVASTASVVILTRAANEELRAETAEANARAAEANEKAESERVERLKLEAKYAPRILSQQQILLLAKNAKPLRGGAIDVVSYETLGTDVAGLSRQIALALGRAGIQAHVFTPDPGTAIINGVAVRTELGSPQQEVNVVVGALVSAGLIVSRMQPYPAGQTIAGAFMGPKGVSPQAKLRILVGAKPQ